MVKIVAEKLENNVFKLDDHIYIWFYVVPKYFVFQYFLVRIISLLISFFKKFFLYWEICTFGLIAGAKEDNFSLTFLEIHSLKYFML